jgi:hypothetical protein
MFDTFPIKNGLKQGGALPPVISNSALEYAIRKVQANRSGWNWMVHPASGPC